MKISLLMCTGRGRGEADFFSVYFDNLASTKNTFLSPFSFFRFFLIIIQVTITSYPF